MIGERNEGQERERGRKEVREGKREIGRKRKAGRNEEWKWIMREMKGKKEAREKRLGWKKASILSNFPHGYKWSLAVWCKSFLQHHWTDNLSVWRNGWESTVIWFMPWLVNLVPGNVIVIVKVSHGAIRKVCYQTMCSPIKQLSKLHHDVCLRCHLQVMLTFRIMMSQAF